ncbi:hypothetical protein WJX72_008480 [[Myrmecia] bisecta]|uniref:Uncharacterized protein n=1 Tax=[Myrmecia] bisecta TaxID=41462 RepID=A0AAW1P6N3_9CHLO
MKTSEAFSRVVLLRTTLQEAKLSPQDNPTLGAFCVCKASAKHFCSAGDFSSLSSWQADDQVVSTGPRFQDRRQMWGSKKTRRFT